MSMFHNGQQVDNKRKHMVLGIKMLHNVFLLHIER